MIVRVMDGHWYRKILRSIETQRGERALSYGITIITKMNSSSRLAVPMPLRIFRYQCPSIARTIISSKSEDPLVTVTTECRAQSAYESRNHSWPIWRRLDAHRDDGRCLLLRDVLSKAGRSLRICEHRARKDLGTILRDPQSGSERGQAGMDRGGVQAA
jgi:hypothetical protein